jgi:hypothetical protein
MHYQKTCPCAFQQQILSFAKPVFRDTTSHAAALPEAQIQRCSGTRKT